MPVTLKHEDAAIEITELPDSRRLVDIVPVDSALFVPRFACETGYPVSLIETFLKVKGVTWLCDEIARDEDYEYIGKLLDNELRAYFDLSEFKDARILDFGCGSGASTMWLARLFKDADITGIELSSELLGLAKARGEHHGFHRIRFLKSPSGSELPKDIGKFDLIVLSAVFEHLLPDERHVLLKKLWSILSESGILFLDQTPNRVFPIELHTTGLPLINYLPDRLVFNVVPRISNRLASDASLEDLYRSGIRGATFRSISSYLHAIDERVEVLEPRRKGISNRVELWYQNSNQDRFLTLKKFSRMVMNVIFALTGIALVPELALAFRKPAGKR